MLEKFSTNSTAVNTVGGVGVNGFETPAKSVSVSRNGMGTG